MIAEWFQSTWYRCITMWKVRSPSTDVMSQKGIDFSGCRFSFSVWSRATAHCNRIHSVHMEITRKSLHWSRTKWSEWRNMKESLHSSQKVIRAWVRWSTTLTWEGNRKRRNKMEQVHISCIMYTIYSPTYVGSYRKTYKVLPMCNMVQLFGLCPHFPWALLRQRQRTAWTDAMLSPPRSNGDQHFGSRLLLVLAPCSSVYIGNSFTRLRS